MLRLSGLDEQYALQLAESGGELPPIIVRRHSWQIIDGLHRWRATQLRGLREIAVEVVDDDDDEAFLRALRANAGHGLPLTLDDRRAAAERILSIKPEWSDRAIGRETGLSGKTVAVIRRADGAFSEGGARHGLDGRVRPIDPAAGRRLAGEFLKRRPEASLREVAKFAGISASTVRDVKQRLRRGEGPVLSPRAASTPSAPYEEEPAEHERAEIGTVLRSVMRDPSLRYSQAGRTVLSWLRLQVELTQEEEIAQALPPHCLERIADLSRRTTARWEHLAHLAAAQKRPRDGSRTGTRSAS
ncbi:ParB N-terminal domain-containing protein [Kribbella sp. NPDC056345]|uniref:ParB/RepB/Spo0J family partition protein n=1 Tax=Kribbella sp. NPDC056345 TaxID=3345789 RepID=UPI0035E1F134